MKKNPSWLKLKEEWLATRIRLINLMEIKVAPARKAEKAAFKRFMKACEEEGA